MKLKQDVYYYTLAGLLHDIGKFYQRTGYPIIVEETRQFAKGNSYLHAAYTAQFIYKYLDEKLNYFAYDSANHHNAKDGIIKTADIYSAGHDRRSEESYQQEEQSSHYITDRMYSIFYILFGNSKNNPSYINLSTQSKYFPSPVKEFSELSNKDAIRKSKSLYKKLFNEMTKKISETNVQSLCELHHFIYPVIKEYTTTIPSATFQISIPTVSLFDHLKLTAGISNCLFFGKEINNKDYFVIVEYELKGIKNFVYNFINIPQINENYQALIRMRSLYLNILCDFIAYKIINEFNLTYENILYTTGGKGQILIPNITNCMQKLDKLINEISSELSKFDHNIYFKFRRLTLTSEELQKGKFRWLIQNSKSNGSIINYNKKCDKTFTSVNCPLCGIVLSKLDNKCKFCENLIKLNELFCMNRHAVIVEFEFEKNHSDAEIIFDLGTLGKILFHNKINTIKMRNKSYYLTLNQPFIGEVKYYATSTIDFKLLTKRIKESNYNERLAILTIDVDNIGYIFGQGFEEDKTTISKILTLSRNIEFFFAKVINDITGNKKFKNLVSIIYAGGDDLVAFLPASLVLDFIYEVNNLFNRYVNFHPMLHLSSSFRILSQGRLINDEIFKAFLQLTNVKKTLTKNGIGYHNLVIPNNKLSIWLNDVRFYLSLIKTNKFPIKIVENIYLKIIDLEKYLSKGELVNDTIRELRVIILTNITDLTLKDILITKLTTNVNSEKVHLNKAIFGYILEFFGLIRAD